LIPVWLGHQEFKDESAMFLWDDDYQYALVFVLSREKDIVVA